MPINILMPALSPTMDKGKLTRWLKKEGEPVKSGDVLAEIETDKATMEIEAVDEGTLGKILVADGTEDVAVNTPIAVILAEGESADAIAVPAKSEAGAKPPPAASPPKQTEGPKPATAPTASAPAAAPAAAQQPAARQASNGRVFASPLARRLAKEKGLDLGAVKGSGPHGRIIARDVEAARPGGAAPQRAPGGGLQAAMPDEMILKLYEPGSYEVVPHDGMRKIIAQRLLQAKQTIPHFYLTVDCKLDELLILREKLNAHAPVDDDKNPAWKLSVNDFMIKSMALALQRVPEANATWTEGGMLRHKHSDVGVAVAIEGGLFTPVVRQAETKSLPQISGEMKDLAGRARKRRLAPHEYQGGTTAISNLGMFGVTEFAAVINPPHASILAVGAGEKRPIVEADAVVVRTLMTVTLSCDHRVVDGALGAKLLGAFKTLIEDPALMMV